MLLLVIGYNLNEASTLKICKLQLTVGYDLIEAPTSMMRKIQLALGSNLIEAITSMMKKISLSLGSNLIEAPTLTETPTFFFNFLWTSFQNISHWIDHHHLWLSVIESSLINIITMHNHFHYNHCHILHTFPLQTLQNLSWQSLQLSTRVYTLTNHILIAWSRIWCVYMKIDSIHNSYHNM